MIEPKERLTNSRTSQNKQSNVDATHSDEPFTSPKPSLTILLARLIFFCYGLFMSFTVLSNLYGLLGALPSGRLVVAFAIRTGSRFRTVYRWAEDPWSFVFFGIGSEVMYLLICAVLAWLGFKVALNRI